MIIKNNTHYFNEYSRIFNSFPDQDSFEFESSKRMGYFQRLFFEYAYTRKVRGMCFYYTLTYNDAHIPQFLGHNCFSYDDVRRVTNGKISKVLLRQYGSRLRYFCACESGEGKGKRGLGNNPHYHFIFFVQPVHDSFGEPDYSHYVPISTQAFKDLIYEVWQGKPSTRFVPWQLARYGHCQEGKYNGEVLSIEALKYCGKYVVKDVDERNFESRLTEIFAYEARKEDISNRVLYVYYKYLKSTSIGFTKEDFFRHLHLHEYNKWRHTHYCASGVADMSLERFLTDYYTFPHGQIAHFQVTGWFNDFYIPEYISSRLSEYRNKWSGKCRMSKSLGEYGLQFVTYDCGQPRIVLNTSNGYEVQYPCLYYIRKLFYDVRICPITGNPLYYLNEAGIQMKLSSYPLHHNQFVSKVKEYIRYKQDNCISLSESDSDLDFNYLLDCIVNKVEYKPRIVDVLFSDLVSSPAFDDIIDRYAYWHYVYQYRHYNKYFQSQLDASCKLTDVLEDYCTFLKYNSYYLDFETGSVYDMVYKSGDSVVSYSSHPAFQPYVHYFKYLDILIDVVGKILSDGKKQEFNESSEHQKRLNALRFNCSIF